MPDIKRIWFISFFVFLYTGVFGQDKPDWEFNFSGYLKSLQGVLTSPDLPDDYYIDLLIHNRLNARLTYKSNLSLSVSSRNRLFYGDLVEIIPRYYDLVENANNDWLDLSILWVADDAVVLNTNFDRLYLEYVRGDWEARIGRQRINWGINLLWNPNDLFNTFDFTDFDYEERPGSDAIWLKHYTGFTSSWEFAFKAADTFDEVISAFMLKGNKNDYDYQILAGKYLKDIAIGGGWAGRIKDAGFKGECTVFIPYKDDEPVEVSMALGLDYAFEKAWYTTAGVMYNSTGSSTGTFGNLFVGEITAKNLYPFTYALFSSTNYTLNPLLTAYLTVVYSPVKAQSLFVNPGITYNVATNWDLELLGQLSWLNRNEEYISGGNFYYFRVKWSF